MWTEKYTRMTDTLHAVEQLGVKCLCCNRMNFSTVTHYPDADDPFKKVKCSGLSRHINSCEPCLEYYCNAGLANPRTASSYIFNLTTSFDQLINEDTTSAPSNNPNNNDVTQKYCPRDLGLRMSSSGKKNFHQSVNDQTLYVPVHSIEKTQLDYIVNYDTEVDPLFSVYDTDSDNSLLVDDNDSIEPVPTSNANTNVIESDPPFSSSSNKILLDTTVKRGIMVPSGQSLAELDLMNLMVQHKMPLQAHKSIFEWAITSQQRLDFSFATAKSRKRHAILKDLCACLGRPTDYHSFHPKIVNWKPHNKPAQVYVRGFKDALFSLLENSDLMKDENLSFPDPHVPYIWNNFPSPGEDTAIKELHHGKWWVDSWKEKCSLPPTRIADNNDDVIEILVPIIFYMDGVAIDKQGRLKLTPLNMTLGIFNTSTRKKKEAWETLYFHPDSTVMQISHNSHGSEKGDSVRNLHAGLSVALQSFYDTCQLAEGIEWKGLPYGGKKWHVRLKFSIAYVIGDTPQHDQLCGRYSSYGTSIKCMCRHCLCKSEDLVNPNCQHKYRLYTMEDFSHSPDHDIKYFESISHHDIENAFDRLDFGSNVHKIHLASPGELLHMHQLGPEKRAVEAFIFVIHPGFYNKKKSKTTEARGENILVDADAGNADNVEQSKKKKRKRTDPKPSGPLAYTHLGSLAQTYGALLSRQSDRDFPRTRFSSTYILNTAMKEGNHYAGILLSILVSLVSRYGKKICKQHATDLCDDNFIVMMGQIETIELLLMMEEFLKKGVIKVGQIPKFRSVVDKFINLINKNSRRNVDAATGHGTRLIKNHLYFHLHQHMEYFGPISGWDSSPTESHHKDDLKAPAKTTQLRPSTLVKQVANRKDELGVLRDASREFSPQKLPNNAPKVYPVSGARFTIKKNNTSCNDYHNAVMTWHKPNEELPIHSKEVLKFCVETVLPCVTSVELVGFTEHQRFNAEERTKHIYRAHPSYRSKSNQQCNSWYDWAYFIFDDEPYPCQIQCFVTLKDFDISHIPKNRCKHLYYSDPGAYAVVRMFKQTPVNVQPCKPRSFSSQIVLEGELSDQFGLISVDCIDGDVAVVPNYTDKCKDTMRYQTNNKFFVVKNRTDWLSSFMELIENSKSKE